MAEVSYERTTLQYPGTSHPAVQDLELTVADGEFMVLVGPSGSGKSTALRMLAGLEPIDSGVVRIGGTDVSNQPPAQRDIAMVFQNYALYPSKTVAQNMGFALKMQGVSAAQRQRKVSEAAELLGLQDFLDRKPKALSGGQRQRVAMGRAIVREPQVFLMDEPLSNLDAKLRVATRTQIAGLQRRLGTTTVYVTHDQVEAMTMGDRVAVLADGVLHQCASPEELYDHPRNVFVAGFIGSPAMNLHETVRSGNSALLGATAVKLPHEDLPERITIGARPEHIQLVDQPGDNVLDAEVVLVEALGSDTYLHARVPDGPLLVARAPGRSPHRHGDGVRLRLDPETMHVFDTDSGARCARESAPAAA